MLSERQHELILFIVRDHIHTTFPVASERIHRKTRIAASPATIRNELGTLTSNGFLEQAHTSSGRIPTQKAYRHFIDSLLYPLHPEQNTKQKGGSAEKSSCSLSALAKEFSLFTALGHFGRSRRIAISGTTHLFANPELHTGNTLLANFAYLLDHLEEVLLTYLRHSHRQKRLPAVFIGKENPVRALHSFSVFSHAGAHENILLWVGPMRIDYEHVIPTLAALSF